MIDFIHIENFKTLLEADFPLSSLNLFSGLNGMGKSSLIQTLLLLRQSFERNTLPDKGLLLNGDYAKLGTGNDVFSANAESSQVRFLIKHKDEPKGQEFLFNEAPDSDLLPIENDIEVIPLHRSLLNRNFQYLAADRISPQSNYEISDYHIRDLNTLGNHGEYTVHYIAENALEKLSIEGLQHPNVTEQNFLINLEAWMAEITPGINIQANTQKQFNTATLSYSFGQGKDKTADFKPQNVGFGLTFALPVVTAIIRAKPGDLLILENPESHLHPAGQAMIGKLCCMAASRGVQFFIESHSDHFLNGIRVAVKNKLIGNEEVSLFFLERPFEQTTHSSIIHNPSIDENGRLDYWPEGFFDEWDKQLDELL
ncbi:MAG: DUF3696 domain-containing protein [bacterium]|nr:DUF3696 domain-containing protein [bacterium]